MEINWKQLKTESISTQIGISIHIELTDFSILLSFKNKQYKNTNIANFVYYGKTRMTLTDDLHTY